MRVLLLMMVPLSAAFAAEDLARDIFRQLIEINTTDSSGGTTKAAQAMADRLLAAGFPSGDVRVAKDNLVARYRGTGAKKPLLLLAHLDVVEARREDWSFDPFQFLERDGYYYGRGTSDDKSMAAIWIANFMRYRREGFQPDRDLIVALTAGEESGVANGVSWLLGNHRDWIEAEYCLNEGGDGQSKNGKRLLNGLQASEKNYLSFHLEVKNKGGHSSLPEKDNAIYRLAEGLTRLAKFDFPVRLNEVTRAYFERMARIESGQTARDLGSAANDPAAAARLSQTPFYNAQLRTTCVATQLEAGHAENALPQKARATVNCRLLPDESFTAVETTLKTVLADSQITVTPDRIPELARASPLRKELLEPAERITNEMWPGVPVVPLMATGATDGHALRLAGIPTYGMSGIFGDIDDVREHGRDERVSVQAFHEGLEFLYRLVKALSQ